MTARDDQGHADDRGDGQPFTAERPPSDGGAYGPESRPQA